MRFRFIAAVSVLVATLGSAQETVLVPVMAFAQIHGVNNTVFQTRLYVATAAGPQFVVPAQAKPLTAGRLLQFDSGADLFYELVITGPDGSLHRTTVPIARERNFKTGPSVLMGLTTVSRWRNRLRVYDVDNTGKLHARVRITIEPLRGYGPFFDQDVAVSSRDADDPTYPFYADVALPDLCITAPTGITCNDYEYTLSIEPSNATTRYWAFASATDNASGETSLFFAQ